MNLKSKNESLHDLKSIIMLFVKGVKTELFITTKDKSLYRIHSYKWQEDGMLCRIGAMEDAEDVLIKYSEIQRIENKFEKKVFYEVAE
ncbi:hypothetical protein [Bacillus sp. NPDC094106]|uniref:hypothetical protein n=1 Tax=Bacillus sp. NPDC094106 TaxID=3363949 RepID=UPI0038285A13